MFRKFDLEAEERKRAKFALAAKRWRMVLYGAIAALVALFYLLGYTQGMERAGYVPGNPATLPKRH